MHAQARENALPDPQPWQTGQNPQLPSNANISESSFSNLAEAESNQNSKAATANRNLNLNLSKVQ